VSANASPKVRRTEKKALATGTVKEGEAHLSIGGGRKKEARPFEEKSSPTKASEKEKTKHRTGGGQKQEQGGTLREEKRSIRFVRTPTERETGGAIPNYCGKKKILEEQHLGIVDGLKSGHPRRKCLGVWAKARLLKWGLRMRKILNGKGGGTAEKKKHNG